MMAISNRETRSTIVKWFGTAETRGRELGKMFVESFMPVLHSFADAEEVAGQMLDNVIVAVALARHRRDTRAYPTKLDALAPKYLKTLPEDRFAFGPLTYRRTGDGYVLSSVGRDGNANADNPKGDDLVIRMPRARE